MNDTKIIRYSELAKELGVSKSTIWRWRNSGRFPRPLNLGPRIVGWRTSDIQDWLNNENQMT